MATKQRIKSRIRELQNARARQDLGPVRSKDDVKRQKSFFTDEIKRLRKQLINQGNKGGKKNGDDTGRGSTFRSSQ